MVIAYLNLQRYGLYPLNCREWEIRTVNCKTFPHLRTAFVAAERHLRVNRGMGVSQGLANTQQQRCTCDDNLPGPIRYPHRPQEPIVPKIQSWILDGSGTARHRNFHIIPTVCVCTLVCKLWTGHRGVSGKKQGRASRPNLNFPPHLWNSTCLRYTSVGNYMEMRSRHDPSQIRMQWE